MRAGLRDLRLVPAAVAAWLVAGMLVGLRGAAEVAPAVAVAAWLIAGGACAVAVLRRTPGLAAVAIAAAAGAWPATTLSLGAERRYDTMPAWAQLAAPLRERFQELVADLPGGGGELLPGLAIGDDRNVGAALHEAMRTTSLTHLTAVSGANCALVVGAVMVAGTLLGVPRGVRIASAIAALGAFVLLVTPQPSVVRAAVMAAVALVGLAAARPVTGLPLLSLAIAAILGVQPPVALELGFVLSVLATTGLLVLSGPLGALAAGILPTRLATALAVPVAAQLAVQPAIALIEPELPTYGVLANLLAVPAAPAATVLGMLACLVAPWAPGLAQSIAQLAWLPSQWIAAVATTLAGLPAARLPWPPGALGVLLHVGLLLAGAAVVLGRHRHRVVAGLLVLAAAAGYAGSLSGTGIARTIDRPTHWSIAVCDVGQGDAVLVRSGGLVALVDTGPDPRALAGCLRELDIPRVDLLVLTHFDRDHVGGVDAVLGRVGTVLTGPADPASAREVLGALVDAGAEVVAGRIGVAGTLGGYGWRVLWPPARGAPAVGNDTSLVLRLDPGPEEAGPSLVLLGDLGASAQARMLGRGVGGPAAVVKVSHHGSADQHAPLYSALAPRLALIGVGVDNDYGHPARSILETLTGLGAAIARSDVDGLVLVPGSEDGGLAVWRGRAGHPRRSTSGERSSLVAWRARRLHGALDRPPAQPRGVRGTPSSPRRSFC